MKHFIYLLIAFASVTMVSCGGSEGTNNELQAKVDSLTNVISTQQASISAMRDSIAILQFPADQRLAKIKQLIAEESFDNAKKEISALLSYFPNSQEAVQCPNLTESINTKIAAIEAEKERIKAQGFKVFKDNLSCSDNEENYSFSGFTFGRTFTFDNCNDVNEYSYRTADKDNTYLLFSLRMSTKKKYASPPSIYIYEVSGDKLKRLTHCMEEYAGWTSYGAKIGNYSDDSHDFSKVNSVNYKFAGEISQSDAKRPLFVVFSKNGRSLKDEMSVDEVHADCIVIKVINRNAI